MKVKLHVKHHDICYSGKPARTHGEAAPHMPTSDAKHQRGTWSHENREQYNNKIEKGFIQNMISHAQIYH